MSVCLSTCLLVGQSCLSIYLLTKLPINSIWLCFCLLVNLCFCLLALFRLSAKIWLSANTEIIQMGFWKSGQQKQKHFQSDLKKTHMKVVWNAIPTGHLRMLTLYATPNYNVKTNNGNTKRHQTLSLLHSEADHVYSTEHHTSFSCAMGEFCTRTWQALIWRVRWSTSTFPATILKALHRYQ